jgi:hypothetical protein
MISRKFISDLRDSTLASFVSSVLSSKVYQVNQSGKDNDYEIYCLEIKLAAAQRLRDRYNQQLSDLLGTLVARGVELW